MAIDHTRRRLLAALPAGVVLAHPRLAAAVPAPAHAALLTCWADHPTRPRHFFAGLGQAMSTALALPARGHDVFWHPANDGSAIVVARRPGRFLVRWDVASGKTLARFDTGDALDDIRLEGHFAFSADGRRLYATESDLITGRGHVGVYDTDSLARLGRHDAGGIGPHAIGRLADGTLAVAIGGVLTLPETGRVKRNLDSMDPSLVILDPASGQILRQLRLPDPWMSVRHVAQAADGTIGVALQNEGGPDRPLLARVQGEALVYAEADAATRARCGGYAGDVMAIDGHFALSASTAGITALWTTGGRHVGTLDTPRVCALTRAGRQLVATGDGGDVWTIDPQGPRILSHSRYPVALDNHAARPPAVG